MPAIDYFKVIVRNPRFIIVLWLCLSGSTGALGYFLGDKPTETVEVTKEVEVVKEVPVIKEIIKEIPIITEKLISPDVTCICENPIDDHVKEFHS